MKLTTLVPFQGLAFPGLKASQMMTIVPGVSPAPYKDWRVHVRGPSVFFISPPGWQIGKASSGSRRVAYELPRSHCYLGWDLDPGDKLDGVGKYDPPCDGCGAPIALEDHLLCAACTKQRDADLVKLMTEVQKGVRAREADAASGLDAAMPIDSSRAEPSLGLTVEGANPESPSPTATAQPTFSDDDHEDDVRPRGKRR